MNSPSTSHSSPILKAFDPSFGPLNQAWPVLEALTKCKAPNYIDNDAAEKFVEINRCCVAAYKLLENYSTEQPALVAAVSNQIVELAAKLFRYYGINKVDPLVYGDLARAFNWAAGKIPLTTSAKFTPEFRAFLGLDLQ